MEEIKRDCEKLLVHIKKCKDAMQWDGYTDAGVIGYFARLPFKKIHRNHFAKIETYTERLIAFTQENKIDVELEGYKELINSSIIYNSNQVAALGYKQFEHKINYLEDLEDNIIQLLEIVI